MGFAMLFCISPLLSIATGNRSMTFSYLIFHLSVNEMIVYFCRLIQSARSLSLRHIVSEFITANTYSTNVSIVSYYCDRAVAEAAAPRLFFSCCCCEQTLVTSKGAFHLQHRCLRTVALGTLCISAISMFSISIRSMRDTDALILSPFCLLPFCRWRIRHPCTWCKAAWVGSPPVAFTPRGTASTTPHGLAGVLLNLAGFRTASREAV